MSALKLCVYKAQMHEPWAITALNKTPCTGSPALSKVGPSRVSVKLPGPELNTIICLCLFDLHPTCWESQPIKNLFPSSTDPAVINTFETVISSCYLWDHTPPHLDSMLLYITPIKISPFTRYLDLLLLSISKFRFLFLTFPSPFFFSLSSTSKIKGSYFYQQNGLIQE